MYCWTVSKPSIFFRCSSTMKHTTSENEILVLVLCQQAKVRNTDSCLNLEAENREKSELLTASHLSALVINEIAGLLGLCVMVRVLCLAHHPSTLINSSRTDVTSSRELLFWLKKKKISSKLHTHFFVHPLFHNLHFMMMDGSAMHWESLSSVYWQRYLVSTTLALHLMELIQREQHFSLVTNISLFMWDRQETFIGMQITATVVQVTDTEPTIFDVIGPNFGHW